MKESICYILGNTMKKDTEKRLTSAIQRLIDLDFWTFYIGYDTKFCDLAHSILLKFAAEYQYIKIFRYTLKHKEKFYYYDRQICRLPELKPEMFRYTERQLYNHQMLCDCEVVLGDIAKNERSDVYQQYKMALELNKFFFEF